MKNDFIEIDLLKVVLSLKSMERISNSYLVFWIISIGANPIGVFFVFFLSFTNNLPIAELFSLLFGRFSALSLCVGNCHFLLIGIYVVFYFFCTPPFCLVSWGTKKSTALLSTKTVLGLFLDSSCWQLCKCQQLLSIPLQLLIQFLGVGYWAVYWVGQPAGSSCQIPRGLSSHIYHWLSHQHFFVPHIKRITTRSDHLN